MGAEKDKETNLHRPVMVAEVRSLLDCRPGDVLVDCTSGRGGHSLALAEDISPGGYLLAIDLDAEAVGETKKRLEGIEPPRHVEQANFTELPKLLRERSLVPDRIIFDLGVSSPQLDDAGRGFSFGKDGPLDMRMDRTGEETAADLVNRLPVRELERIIRLYGEERWAGRISRAIARERGKDPIINTARLAGIILRAVPGRGRIHPATRTFQALRIYLNRELDSLQKVLPEAVSALKPGGRICVISFHSLEDRIVKRAFRRSEREKGEIRILTPKPVRPSPREVKINPRARSARLRAAEKIK